MAPYGPSRLSGMMTSSLFQDRTAARRRRATRHLYLSRDGGGEEEQHSGRW